MTNVWQGNGQGAMPMYGHYVAEYMCANILYDM